MMNSKADLHLWLPRHIRKIVQQKEKQPTPLDAQRIGWVDMSSSNSSSKSIGTEQSYFQYPDLKATKLKGQLAVHHELPSTYIALGNGSTGVLDTILRSFCVPTEHGIVSFSPIQQRLQHLADVQALDVLALPLEPDGQLPILESDKIEATNRLIYIENPNHIRGSLVSSFDVADIVTKFDGIVVIDESAIDYSSTYSLASLVETCPNLIVIHSFSGAWGLAGLRIGYALANPAIIEVLEAVQSPFTISGMAQEAATQALYVADKRDRVVEQVLLEKQKLLLALSLLPVVKKVHDSHTNTILIEVNEPAALVDYLYQEEKIALLDVSNLVGCANCVRITVGQELDNMRLLNALKDVKYNKIKSGQWMGLLRRAGSILGMIK